MTTGANIRETVSISTPRTGSMRLARIALTGWGDAATPPTLETFSDHGRLWVKYTTATATLEMFRRSTMLSGDRVAYTSTAAADGLAVLVEDNSSGISGTCEVDNGTPGTLPTADVTMDIIISYASEYDLRSIQAQVAQLLDSTTSDWQAQGNRFERLLNEAKIIVDRWIIKEQLGKLCKDTWSRLALAHIVNQYDLRRTQALVALHIATLNRAGVDPDRMDQANNFLALAKNEFRDISLVFDNERDLSPDDATRAGVVRIVRS